MLALITVLSAEPVFSQEINLVQVGETLVSGSNHWVKVNGHYLYSATGYGLKVYDISDPDDPQEAAHIPTTGVSNCVEISDTLLFLSDSDDGLKVYSISDPENPVYISGYNTPGTANSIMIYGDYVYLFAKADGIQILDASDPYNLDLVTVFYPVGEPSMGVYSNNYMYVSIGVPGMAIYNLSNPEDPVLANTWNTLVGRTMGLSLSPDDHFLMLSDNTNGCYILQLTSPYNPVYPGTAGQVIMAGAKAIFTASQATYSICSYQSSHIVSFNYAGNPLDTLNIGGESNLAIYNGYAFICKNDSLLIVDCEPAQIMGIEGVYRNNGFCSKAAVIGNYIYSANMASGLAVVDISNPSNPVFADSNAQNIYATNISVHPDDQILYVTDYYRGVHIFDAADPENPVFIRTLESLTDSMATKALFKNGYLYVDYLSYGIKVYDASDPSYPVFAFEKAIPAGVIDFDLSDDGEFLILSTFGTGIRIFKVYAPDSLQYINSLSNFTQVQSLDINGDFCYAGDFAKGVYIIDISNPYFPIQLDSIMAEDYITAVRAINSQYIAVSDCGRGNFIADVTNPMDIFKVSSMETPGVTLGFAVKDNYLIISDNYSLIIADMYYNGVTKEKFSTACADFQLFPAYPNPFNNSVVIKYEISRDIEVKITLFNAVGQEIEVLHEGFISAGEYSKSIDNSGMPSGIYFISINSGEMSKIQKLVMIK